jgi:hypothetical protein
MTDMNLTIRVQHTTAEYFTLICHQQWENTALSLYCKLMTIKYTNLSIRCI